jgi:hypothetical protein
MAADAGHRARTIGHRVEVLCGQPGRNAACVRRARCGQRRFLLAGNDAQAGGDGRRGEEAADAFGDDAGDGGDRQFAGGRQQPVAFAPLANFVELADDARADIVRQL